MKALALPLFAAACVALALSAAGDLPFGSLVPPALFGASMIVALLTVTGNREPRL